MRTDYFIAPCATSLQRGIHAGEEALRMKLGHALHGSGGAAEHVRPQQDEAEKSSRWIMSGPASRPTTPRVRPDQ